MPVSPCQSWERLEKHPGKDRAANFYGFRPKLGFLRLTVGDSTASVSQDVLNHCPAVGRLCAVRAARPLGINVAQVTVDGIVSEKANNVAND
jgi:hypothetical protein